MKTQRHFNGQTAIPAPLSGHFSDRQNKSSRQREIHSVLKFSNLVSLYGHKSSFEPPKVTPVSVFRMRRNSLSGTPAAVDSTLDLHIVISRVA